MCDPLEQADTKRFLQLKEDGFAETGNDWDLYAGRYGRYGR